MPYKNHRPLHHKLLYDRLMESIPSFEEMPKQIAILSGQLAQLTKDVNKLTSQLLSQPKSIEIEQFIGIEEACDLLHLAKPTIYKMAQKGLIPHYKPTKELLFRKSELIKWVENSHRAGKMTIEDIAAAITVGHRRKAKRWD